MESVAAVTAAPPLPLAEETPKRALASGADSRRRYDERMLAYADLSAAYVALWLCVVLLGDDRLKLASLLALPVVVLVSKVQGLYDRDSLLIHKTTIDEAGSLFQLATLYALVFWLLGGHLVDGTLGESQVLVLWGSFFALSLLARRTARSLAARSSTPERCLFVGDAASYGRLEEKLADDELKAEMVGRMSLQRTARRGRRNTQIDELRTLLTWTGAHRLIIEPQCLEPDDMLDFVRAAKSSGVSVSLLPRVFDVVGSSVVFDDLNGLTLLGVPRFGLSPTSRRFKRAFDLTGAVAAVVVAAPLLALIAAIVKLDSCGPVLFRQTRVGRDGRHFRICKFRTMCVDAEERKDDLRDRNEAGDGLFKIADDPRITRAGRFLRKTALDELPQLFNVLRGDMSLVGPRPLVVDEDERITGWDRRRLDLTPGMTGHWQIASSARVPMHEMLKIDYLYVASWTLWSDVKILLRTVPYMLSRRGM